MTTSKTETILLLIEYTAPEDEYEQEWKIQLFSADTQGTDELMSDWETAELEVYDNWIAEQNYSDEEKKQLIKNGRSIVAGQIVYERSDSINYGVEYDSRFEIQKIIPFDHQQIMRALFGG